MVKVTLVQTSKYKWHLMSPNGKVILDDLLFADTHKAETWVRAYVSTWASWDYELQPLKGE